MSEQINGTLPFPGMEESETLDFDAIFGGGSGTGDANPFDAPAAQAAEPAPTPEQAPEAPAQPVSQPAPAAAEQPKTQDQPQEKPAAQETPASAAPNLIEAAFAQQETKAAQTAVKSLFEKPAVFTYGSAKDEIADGAMTFEELRIAKSEDFPELGEGKRVSWSVEYGKVAKRITDPKGVFSSLEEARAPDKAICLLPSGDGRVYELRKNEMGEFIAPKDNVAEFEALAHILWDRVENRFVVHVPPQEGSKARVNADLSRDELPEERYLHYADIHSHNSMAAKVSPVDDLDERATRVYIVLGKLDRFFPRRGVPPGMAG